MRRYGEIAILQPPNSVRNPFRKMQKKMGSILLIVCYGHVCKISSMHNQFNRLEDFKGKSSRIIHTVYPFINLFINSPVKDNYTQGLQDKYAPQIWKLIVMS